MSRAKESTLKLATTLDPAMLRSLADPRSFARGEAYFEEGRVRTLTEWEGLVRAQVEGMESYSVKLWHKGKALGYSCSCPRGHEGDFCKHCVAVGLAVVAGERRPDVPLVRGPKFSIVDIREYLEGADKRVLIDFLLTNVSQDGALREQLFLQMARDRGDGGVDADAFKDVLRRAIEPADFLDWREASEHAEGIGRAIDSIERLLNEAEKGPRKTKRATKGTTKGTTQGTTKKKGKEKEGRAGQAEVVVELLEYALQQVERAMSSLDDSNGDMGAILERLQELHLRACELSPPEPEELARRLFAWEMRSDFDVFHGAVETYSEVLGDKGVAEYRRLAEEKWREVPVLGAGQREAVHLGRRFRITSIMTALARIHGDVEALVEVLERDLSHPYCYLQIAGEYKRAGSSALALEWAERGLRAFPSQLDPRLREFVTQEYLSAGRHDEAQALAWAAFEQQPGLERYKDLKRCAERTKSWAQWRERAITLLRARLTKPKRDGASPAWSPHADSSRLVEILL